MEQLLLRPREAAEAVGIGRTLFYRLVKAGTIPSCRVGKSVRIPAAALRAWAAALGREQPADAGGTGNSVRPLNSTPRRSGVLPSAPGTDHAKKP